MDLRACFLFVALAAAIAVAACGSSRDQQQRAFERRLGPVGRHSDGTQTTPTNQTLTPEGVLVDLPGLRPQVLALSRDGAQIYTAGKTSELLVLAASDGAVLQRVPLPSDQQTPFAAAPSARELNPDDEGQVSFTGLAVAPDGRRIYLANVRGSITSSRASSRTIAVAERGRALISAISPKNSPGGSTASTRSLSPTRRRISTVPAPCQPTWKNCACSVWLATT